MNIIPYLSFEGNAQEALDFYADALGGEIQGIMRYSEMPPSDDMPIPEEYNNKILHAALKVQDAFLFFSDTFPGMSIEHGNHIELTLDCKTEEELRTIFDKLSDGGNITMPVAEQFWNSLFGSVTDKYGFGWSLNYDLPKE